MMAQHRGLPQPGGRAAPGFRRARISSVAGSSSRVVGKGLAAGLDSAPNAPWSRATFIACLLLVANICKSQPEAE